MRLVPPLAAALIPLAAIAAPPTPALGATDAGVAQVEASLAATQTMTAHFVQTDGKGRQLDGQFSLKRPGRIRFDYGRAANMLVVSDGQRLNFLDYSAPQMSSWPIDKTPDPSVLLVDYVHVYGFDPDGHAARCAAPGNADPAAKP